MGLNNRPSNRLLEACFKRVEGLKALFVESLTISPNTNRIKHMIEFSELPEPKKSPESTLPVLNSSPNPPITPKPLSKTQMYPGSRPNGNSPFSVACPTKFNWVLAKELCIKMQTRYLIDIVKDYDSLDISTINHWMLKYPKFSQWCSRSRTMFADYLAEKSGQLFDEPPIMETMTTKNGTYERISMSGVQRERYKSQAMQWIAGKFNQEKYGEKVTMNNTFDLTEVLRVVNGPIKQAKKSIDVPTMDK